MTATAAQIANVTRLYNLYKTYADIDAKIALVYIDEASIAADAAGMAVEADSMRNIYFMTKREAYP